MINSEDSAHSYIISLMVVGQLWIDMVVNANYIQAEKKFLLIFNFYPGSYIQASFQPIGSHQR